MARRGFFAELQHQARLAARAAERRQRAAFREHQAAVRRAEQARKADDRARAQTARAANADRKRLEKEAKTAHVAAMEAEVEERNSGLVEIYDEIDNLLAATLGVDDYVDLNTLRLTVEHPPGPVADLPEPAFTAPDPPRGFFGKRKKHAEAMARAEAAHARALAGWRRSKKERARYELECAEREAEVAAHNSKIDALIANLGYGTVDAVQEYVSIVLSTAVYPDYFPIEHEFTFDPSTAELRMRALVPPPSAVPSTKAYKYIKASGEITSTDLPQKACRDRYAGAIQQVALRSLHEVFEADRRGLIKSVSLEVGTETTSPATGRAVYVPFVAVGAERDAFLHFDLSAVVPAATLEYLGAAVSKDPYLLVPAETGGVRRS